MGRQIRSPRESDLVVQIRDLITEAEPSPCGRSAVPIVRLNELDVNTRLPRFPSKPFMCMPIIILITYQHTCQLFFLRYLDMNIVDKSTHHIQSV